MEGKVEIDLRKLAKHIKLQGVEESELDAVIREIDEPGKQNAPANG
jgi:hypothetical protein